MGHSSDGSLGRGSLTFSDPLPALDIHYNAVNSLRWLCDTALGTRHVCVGGGITERGVRDDSILTTFGNTKRQTHRQTANHS